MIVTNEVRIEKLAPMRVACALGYGASPELQAWSMLADWAGGNGTLAGWKEQRFFGFNNPNPHPGSPNYGYEQWVTVAPGVVGSDQVTIKDIPGGEYAVLRFEGISQIGEMWKRLVLWVEESPYSFAGGECLEECLTPELLVPGMQAVDVSDESRFEKLVFDLYQPVVPPAR